MTNIYGALLCVIIYDEQPTLYIFVITTFHPLVSNLTVNDVNSMVNLLGAIAELCPGMVYLFCFIFLV